MVNYSEYFNAEAFFLGAGYLLLFVCIFWNMLSRTEHTVREKYFFLIAYLLFNLLVYLFSFTSILPFFPDTTKFAELVEFGSHDSSSLGVRLYVLLSYPLRVLALEQIEVYLLFQVFFYFWAVILIWKGWLIHCENLNVAPGNFEILTLLAMLYPASLAFISIPLREFIQIFGFSLFLYGMSKYVYQKKYGILMLGALLTILVRPQLIIVYPIMILIAKRYNFWRLLLLAIILLPLGVIAFEQLLGYHFTPQFFAFLRNAANDNYAESGMVYGKVDWKTYLDIVIDLPPLMAQFVFSPLPIMHSVNPFTMKFLMIDLFFVVFVLLGSVLNPFRVSQTYIYIFLVLLAVFAIWEFYIGGAVRHRFPLIFMLLPLAACYYSGLTKKLYRVKEL